MKIRVLVVLFCLALVGVAAPTTSAHGATSQVGTYYPLATSRILDTRNGTGAPKGQLGAAKQLDLQVSGKSGVPTSGVSAVVFNLTVVGATTSSFLAAFPKKTGAKATSSTINYRKAITRANITTLPLGTSGQITIYNNAGSVDVLADVLGYYASDSTHGAGQEFTTVPPERLVDTRKDPDGQLEASGGNNKLILDVAFGQNGNASQFVSAVAVNVTSVNAGAIGHLTTWDGVGDPPNTSTLNFPDAAAIANLAIIRTSTCPDCDDPSIEFAIANQSSKPVDVLVDLVGIYYNDGTEGLRFAPITPKRITDSRTPLNGKTFTAQGTQTLTAPSSVANANTVALVSNLTAVGPTTSTFLTVWSADDSTRPGVSNLNTPATVTAANGAVIPLSTSSKFNVFNNLGKTDFLIDVTGRFDASTQNVTAQNAGARSVGTDATSSERRAATLSR